MDVEGNLNIDGEVTANGVKHPTGDGTKAFMDDGSRIVPAVGWKQARIISAIQEMHIAPMSVIYGIANDLSDLESIIELENTNCLIRTVGGSWKFVSNEVAFSNQIISNSLDFREAQNSLFYGYNGEFNLESTAFQTIYFRTAMLENVIPRTSGLFKEMRVYGLDEPPQSSEAGGLPTDNSQYYIFCNRRRINLTAFDGGTFNGVIDLSLGHVIYDNKDSGAVVNLSLGPNPLLGAVARFEILGQYVGTIPSEWRLIGDAISTTTDDRNIIMAMYVKDGIFELTNKLLGVGGGDTTAPTITSAVVEAANPSDLVVGFSEAVTITNLNGLSITGGSTPSITGVTGSGTTQLVFTLSSATQAGDNLTLNVTGSNTIIDAASNPLAAVNYSITNNLGSIIYLDWYKLKGSSVGTDGTLNSSTPASSLDNGAYAQSRMSGNNAITFKAPNTGVSAKQGIGIGNVATFDIKIGETPSSYNRLALFAYVDSLNSEIKVFENGTQTGSYTYASNDEVTIRLNGGVGTVENNGSTIHTSAQDLTNKEFHVIGIIHGSFASSEILNAKFETSNNLFQYHPTEFCIWGGLINATDNGGNGSLIGSGTPNSGWANGGIATKALNGDNQLYFRGNGENSVRQSIGLTNTYGGIVTDNLDMDIWVNLDGTGVFKVFEDGGTALFTSTAITNEDAIVFKLSTNTVILQINGKTVYTSGKTFTKPLNVVGLLHADDYTTNQIIESGFRTSANLTPTTL